VDCAAITMMDPELRRWRSALAVLDALLDQMMAGKP
jgi:hypothetical protein